MQEENKRMVRSLFSSQVNLGNNVEDKKAQTQL